MERDGREVKGGCVCYIETPSFCKHAQVREGEEEGG